MVHFTRPGKFEFEFAAIFFFLSKRFLGHLSFHRKLKTKEEQREKNTSMESYLSTLIIPWMIHQQLKKFKNIFMHWKQRRQVMISTQKFWSDANILLCSKWYSVWLQTCGQRLTYHRHGGTRVSKPSGKERERRKTQLNTEVWALAQQYASWSSIWFSTGFGSGMKLSLLMSRMVFVKTEEQQMAPTQQKEFNK